MKCEGEWIVSGQTDFYKHTQQSLVKVRHQKQRKSLSDKKEEVSGQREISQTEDFCWRSQLKKCSLSPQKIFITFTSRVMNHFKFCLFFLKTAIWCQASHVGSHSDDITALFKPPQTACGELTIWLKVWEGSATISSVEYFGSAFLHFSHSL